MRRKNVTIQPMVGDATANVTKPTIIVRRVRKTIRVNWGVLVIYFLILIHQIASAVVSVPENHWFGKSTASWVVVGLAIIGVVLSYLSVTMLEIIEQDITSN